MLFLLVSGCGSAAVSNRGARDGSSSDEVSSRTVAYIEMLERPTRAEWQHPRQAVARLGIRPGDRVADVGSGSGYFLNALSEAVGTEGTVVAQEINPELRLHLQRRIERESLGNVSTRLGTPTEPGFHSEVFDLILMVDVFHHVDDGPAFLRTLGSSLSPGGRIAILDFPPGDSVPTDVAGQLHRISVEDVLAAAEAAGFDVVEHERLEYQVLYMLLPSSL